MAQSTTNLGKIHVFPSETLYNQFKDIIADNDLALLKDDGAYIVAALLEQNGYVKFNNGLILQWGVIYNAKAGALDNDNNNNAVTFPMPFTTVFALSPTFIIEANHANRDVIVNLYSLSNTGAVIRCWDASNVTNDGQLTYIALGK